MSKVLSPKKYMSNFKCTFTGVDEFTDLDNIAEISKCYPFVEWGVLLSTSESRVFNGNRYPSIYWLKENMPKLKAISQETGCSIALHVCGGETKKLLSQEEDSVGLALIDCVNRIQINFAYKENQVNELESLCKRFEDKIFITQHNSNNKDLYLKIKSKNHQVLFDSSGGRGVEPKSWEMSLPSKVCGYAGGLGLDNIDRQFIQIYSVAGDKYWIDMEGKIRTDDKLDLIVCENILYSCQINSMIML